MRDVMIRIHPLASTTDAAFSRINALWFDLESFTTLVQPGQFESGREIDIEISPGSCMVAGLTLSEENLEWYWRKSAAEREWIDHAPRVRFDRALCDLWGFVSLVKGRTIWCDAQFQAPILHSAMKRAALKPFDPEQICDIGTMLKLGVRHGYAESDTSSLKRTARACAVIYAGLR